MSRVCPKNTRRSSRTGRPGRTPPRRAVRPSAAGKSDPRSRAPAPAAYAGNGAARGREGAPAVGQYRTRRQVVANSPRTSQTGKRVANELAGQEAERPCAAGRGGGVAAHLAPGTPGGFGPPVADRIAPGKKQAELKYLEETCNKQLGCTLKEVAEGDETVLDEVGLAEIEQKCQDLTIEDRCARAGEYRSAGAVRGSAAAV